MSNRIMQVLIFYPLFLFSLSFHEAAHAWVSNRLGDPTAKFLGRISLSPLPHMDLMGTLFLPLFGMFTGVPVIGWGKPVPVNPMNFKDPRRGSLWVAAAGPASNIALALGFSGVAWGLIFLLGELPADAVVEGSFAESSLHGIFTICRLGVIFNLMLAVFNLLPFPPLDGGSVLRGILPASMLDAFDRFSMVSFWILLLLFVAGFLQYLSFPVVVVAGWLLP